MGSTVEIPAPSGFLRASSPTIRRGMNGADLGLVWGTTSVNMLGTFCVLQNGVVEVWLYLYCRECTAVPRPLSTICLVYRRQVPLGLVGDVAAVIHCCFDIGFLRA